MWVSFIQFSGASKYYANFQTQKETHYDLMSPLTIHRLNVDSRQLIFSDAIQSITGEIVV